MKILIDADSVPTRVLNICQELGTKYQIPVVTIANVNHSIDSHHHILVEDHPQATDIEMLNRGEKGDLAITNDIGLIALLLPKKVRCLSQSGKEYKAHEMDFLLFEKDLKARHRRLGGRTKGPKKRTAKEDEIFGHSLEEIILTSKER